MEGKKGLANGCLLRHNNNKRNSDNKTVNKGEIGKQKIKKIEKR